MQYYSEYHKIVMQLMNSEVKYFLKNHGRLYTYFWRKGVGLIYYFRYLRHKRKEDQEKYRWGLYNV